MAIHSDLLRARKETDTNPTEKQKKSGNYKKGRFRWFGLEIAIENPKGSVRSGKDENGKRWSIRMKNDYGYVVGSESKADGDPIDVFVGPDIDVPMVYVIDQIIDGKFDEHKCVIGAKSKEDAKKVYLQNYEPNWKGFGGIVSMTVDQFKNWIKNGRTSKPAKGQNVKLAYYCGLKKIVESSFLSDFIMPWDWLKSR